PSRRSLLLTALCLLTPIHAAAAPADEGDEEYSAPEIPLPPEPPPASPPAESNLLLKLLDGLRLEITGVLFAFWSIDVEQANPDLPSPNGANRFDLSRAFVDISPQISE